MNHHHAAKLLSGAEETAQLSSFPRPSSALLRAWCQRQNHPSRRSHLSPHRYRTGSVRDLATCSALYQPCHSPKQVQSGAPGPGPGLELHSPKMFHWTEVDRIWRAAPCLLSQTSGRLAGLSFSHDTSWCQVYKEKRNLLVPDRQVPGTK